MSWAEIQFPTPKYRVGSYIQLGDQYGTIIRATQTGRVTLRMEEDDDYAHASYVGKGWIYQVELDGGGVVTVEEDVLEYV